MLTSDVTFRRDSDVVTADFAIALTPESWLALLPGVVAQLDPERHEDFVAEILRACDRAGVELAGCMADEFIVAKNWM